MRYRFDRGVATKIKKLQTQFISSTTVVVMAITGLSGGLPLFLSKTVFAIAPIDISNSTQLENAIENQADGQTWDIEAGQYALTPNGTITAGGQTGWYLPITANDITINGIGKPTIYGNSYTTNGAWATQDLMAIFGNNVTVNGLNLMPKLEPNKTIEVIGNDATIENTTIEPNTLTSPSEVSSLPDPTEAEWGGSIYYNGGGGTQTLSNVTITNGGISYHAAAAGVHLVFNNVTLSYGTSTDWINGYRYSNHFDNPTGSTLSGTPQVVYHVSSTLGNLDDVLTNLQNGDAIELDSNLTTSQQITLTKSVTLDGNSHTISPNFAKTDNSNNSALGIQADNVTVNNLVEDGTNGTNLHGINVFDATGVNLNDVTVENNDHTGLNVDQSKVTVDNLTTNGNGWDGADVDKTGAVLTVNGTSHHTETGPAIYVDDATIGQVVDTNNQYGFVNNVKQTGDRVYDLKPAVPIAAMSDANGNPVTTGGYIATNTFTFHLSSSSTVTRYQLKYWNNISGSAFNGESHAWSPTNLSATGHMSTLGTYTDNFTQGEGTHDFSFSACDPYGVCSDFSTPFVVTYDKTAPAAPTITAPGARTWYKTTPIVDSWTAVTKDVNGNTEYVDHYQIAYNYDDGHSFGSSTCPGLTISGYSGFIGCRDVSGTSRDHTPGTSEQGGVTIWVRAIDKAGNVGAWSNPVHYYYDSTNPTTDIQVTGLNSNNAANTTFTVEGKASDNLSLNRVYVQLVRQEDGTRYGGTTINLIPNGINPAGVTAPWSQTYDIKTLGLPDGTYAANVEVVDMAGNSFDPGWTADFTVDSTAPTAVITAPTIDQVITGSTLNISGTASDTNFDHYTYVVEDNKQLPLGTPVSVSTPVTAGPLGTWDMSKLGNGSYYVVLDVFDKASNSSEVTSHFTINNPQPPTPHVLSATTTTPSNTFGSTNGTNSGHVKGDSTTTPNTTNDTSNGQVQGDSTTSLGNSTSDTLKASNQFLGLGWWWLLVLAVILGFLWYVFAKADHDEQKS